MIAKLRTHGTLDVAFFRDRIIESSSPLGRLTLYERVRQLLGHLQIRDGNRLGRRLGLPWQTGFSRVMIFLKHKKSDKLLAAAFTGPHGMLTTKVTSFDLSL